MSGYYEKISHATLPVVRLQNNVAFPSIPVSFEISDSSDISALRCAEAADSRIFVCPVAENINRIIGKGTVGTIVKVRQSVRITGGNVRIIADGVSRATILKHSENNGFITAEIESMSVLIDSDNTKAFAYMTEARRILDSIENYLSNISKETLNAIKNITDPCVFSYLAADAFLVNVEDKVRMLEESDPMKRLILLVDLLSNEEFILMTEYDIHSKVQENLNHERRDYYLREQIRVIEDELNSGDGDSDNYFYRITTSRMPDECKEKLLKENERLEKMPFGSSESSLLRTYLDTCLELPWGKTTKDRSNVLSAQKILDADHDGLDKVKERILEFIAVKQMTPNLKSQIICLVGPPGTGKTSVAASIAKATGRKYVRVSLGGIRDEADIRGHRKTYIGSMPGRIMTAISQVGVSNPLILLDEIDKLTSDVHGDPSSALLEALDPEQNKSFRDHFIELPFDLSDCFFITTANTVETIPAPLLDRMEVIELHTYTPAEKLSIAKNHLMGKQLKRHGLTRRALKITDEAITDLIASYTKEAGVRNLERYIASLCRKAAKKMITEEFTKVVIDADDLPSYLGPRKFDKESVDTEDEVGIVNGLAYTEVGGTMLPIEAIVLDGTGKLETTGSLGDVMTESAHIAVSYVRSVADKYKIDKDFYKDKDIHIHAPEGAVPKDGPSAGVTMVTALVSALSGMKVRHDIAMTGEITLRGKVLPIGGLKEKTLAAYNAGVKTVILPKKNLADLDDIDPTVRKTLEFIPVGEISQVLDAALIKEKNVIPEILPASFNEAKSMANNDNIINNLKTDKIGGEHYGS